MVYSLPRSQQKGLKTGTIFRRQDRGRRLGMVAGLVLLILVYGFGEALAKKLASTAREAKELLRVKVHRLVIDPATGQPVVFLIDPREERVLPIWIGPFEANAINAMLQGSKPPRPLTHDLLETVIRKSESKVQRIIITHSQDGIYYATMVIEKEGSTLQLDARPSDSIVMALKFKAPIYVVQNLFKEMAVPLAERQETEERYGLSIQELTPLLAESFAYGPQKGILVSDVRRGSLAEKDGLLRGDIFAEIGGEPIVDLGSFKTALEKAKTAPARIFRRGLFLSLTLHLR
jgi:bifunctional DNase/RNase